MLPPREYGWSSMAALSLLFSAARLATSFSQDQIDWEIKRHAWGAYTPFSPVKVYEAPPHDCKITQVCCIYSCFRRSFNQI
jgi:hypothetical protein